MGLFDGLFSWLPNPLARKKEQEEWDARFTNPPAKRDDKLPIDPDDTPGIT